jgi:hypothetical protein
VYIIHTVSMGSQLANEWEGWRRTEGDLEAEALPDGLTDNDGENETELLAELLALPDGESERLALDDGLMD